MTRPPAAATVPLGSRVIAARQVLRPLLPALETGGILRLTCVRCISPLSTGCGAGTYGEGCQQLCDCAGDAPCDPATGRCLCPPGKTGPTCGSGEFSHSPGGALMGGLTWS